MNSPSCVDNADNILKRFSQLHSFYRIPIRIPKSCRIPVAEAIDGRIISASNTDWNNLVFFPMLAMGVLISPNTAGSSLSSVIHANLRRLVQSPFYPSNICQQLSCHQASRESSSSVNLRSNYDTKLMLNDVNVAIRVVASDEVTMTVRRPRYYATFILTIIVGRWPNCPFGTAASDSVQLRIWHSLRFCPNSQRVTVWLTTSCVSQQKHHRMTMRFGLGWIKISSYLPTLISKEI